MSEKKICGHCQNYGERGRCRIPGKGDNLPFFAPACEDNFAEKERATKEPKKARMKVLSARDYDPNTRVCVECGKRLPLSCFPAKGRGRSYVCDACTEAAKSAPRAAAEPREQVALSPGPSRDQVGTKSPEQIYAEAQKHRAEAVAQALQLATIDEITAELKRRGLSGSLTLKY